MNQEQNQKSESQEIGDLGKKIPTRQELGGNNHVEEKIYEVGQTKKFKKIWIVVGLLVFIVVLLFIVVIFLEKESEKSMYTVGEPCSEEMKNLISVSNKDIKPIESCKAEIISINEESFYWVQVSYGKGMDCPSGCFYQEYSALINQDLKELHELPADYFYQINSVALNKIRPDNMMSVSDECDTSPKSHYIAKVNNDYGWLYEYENQNCLFRKTSDSERKENNIEFSGSIFYYVENGENKINYDNFNFIVKQYEASNLGNGYFTDNTNIFFGNEMLQVEKGDITTFKSLEFYDKNLAYGWAKDKNYVFYNGEVIKNADALTFELSSKNYQRDKNSVYRNGRVVVEMKPNNFIILKNGYVADEDNVWFDNGLADKKYSYFEGKEFIKKLNGVDRDSFMMVSGGRYYDSYPLAKDDSGYYFGMNKFIPSGKVVILGCGYVQDANSVYFNGIKLEDIDMETFEINRGNCYDNRAEEIFGYDAKDKNNNYLYGKIAIKESIKCNMEDVEEIDCENTNGNNCEGLECCAVERACKTPVLKFQEAGDNKIIGNMMVDPLNVSMKEGCANIYEAQFIACKYDGEVVGQLKIIDSYQIKFGNKTKEDAEKKAEEIEQEPSVDFVMIDFLLGNDEK